MFAASAIAALILMVTVSSDYGITWDEPEQDQYGNLIFEYYRSGFVDRSAMALTNVYMYGGLFDVLCAVAERLSHLSRFATRHLLNASVGWLGIVYAARISRLVIGPRAACITILLLLSSPCYFGHCMNNPKDIPFATAYVAGLYYLLRMEGDYPVIPAMGWLKTTGAFASAIAVRFAGLILVGYMWLALVARAIATRCRPSEGARWAIRASVASLAALLAGSLFCPWALQNPFARSLQAIGVLAHFPDAKYIGVLFRGRYLTGASLPASYAPTLLAITTPITIVVTGLASILLFGVYRGDRLRHFAIVWLAFVVPVALVIASHVWLYNGVRHLLFVYPPFVIVAALGCDALLSGDVRPSLRAAGIVVLSLGLFDPLRFAFANHPNEVVYFNELVGGVRGAFGRYDLDYWGNSTKQALDWVVREGGIPPYRSIRISGPQWPTRDVMPSYEMEFGRLTFVGVRKASEADFWIENLILNPATQRHALKTGNIVHIVEADGVPLCIVKAGVRLAVDREEGPGDTEHAPSG